MAGRDKKDRLSPPLMYAFRGAHEARDAKKKLDLRDEAGERVIANRRIAVAHGDHRADAAARSRARSRKR